MADEIPNCQLKTSCPAGATISSGATGVGGNTDIPNYSEVKYAGVWHLGLKVITTPVRSPQANSLCERLIGTVLRKNNSLWLETSLILKDLTNTSDDERGQLHGGRRAELAQDSR